MALSVLNRKLRRDLWAMRGQIAAVALVLGAGLAILIMSLGAVRALEETRDAFYDRYRFADIFATVRRAPNRLTAELAAIPGVRTVETRVVEAVLIDMPDLAEPASAMVLSLPENGPPRLNAIALRQGRLPDPARPDEVLANEAFAEAHKLRPGDTISAIMNGRRRPLHMVGVALSPEYVYALAPGQLMPDNLRFGILWMGREAVGTAFNLDGAFNHLSLALDPGARQPEPLAGIIARVDRLTAPYGGTGAYERADQTSNWFLSGEITQLKSMASVLPGIFLAVAAFLLNVSANRLIATEQSQIGLLKAFGFTNTRIALHYLKAVALMALPGILLGWSGGAILGGWMTQLYADFYRFPFLIYRPDPTLFAMAALIGLGAALLGAAGAVRTAIRLTPAEAMVPPAPPAYRQGIVSRLLGPGGLDQPSLMILRHITRWPLRSGLTTLGIAMATALLVLSLQWIDSINLLLDRQFFRENRQDVTLSFTDTRSRQAVEALTHLPGVLIAEPSRSVPVRLRNGPVSHRVALTGLPADGELTRLIDADGQVIAPPPAGLVLSSKLAEALGASRGTHLTVDVLDGHRPVLDLTVSAIVVSNIGTPAWISLNALTAALRETPSASGALLSIDSRQESALFSALKETPAVAGVMLRSAAVGSFRKTMAESMLIMVTFYVGFAGLVAFGVVYNAARIALSERGRELASLRVMGFTRGEIAYILLGELAVLALAALPAGCAIGYGLAHLIARQMDTELYRIVVHIPPAVYGWAMLTVLVASAVSGWVVARRLASLDLVAVLKTRE